MARGRVGCCTVQTRARSPSPRAPTHHLRTTHPRTPHPPTRTRVCAQAYQVLRRGGVPAERIIVMAYDDIARNEENPHPGKLFNAPGGADVYAGMRIVSERGGACAFVCVARGAGVRGRSSCASPPPPHTHLPTPSLPPPVPACLWRIGLLVKRRQRRQLSGGAGGRRGASARRLRVCVCVSSGLSRRCLPGGSPPPGAARSFTFPARALAPTHTPPPPPPTHTPPRHPPREQKKIEVGHHASGRVLNTGPQDRVFVYYSGGWMDRGWGG